MQRLLVPALFALALVGCQKNHATEFCLGPDGTSQDCGIGCTIEKQETACAKWAEKTKELCGKITKEECQEICDKDKNPTACELVKNWKP
jgi:hypothetical protein